MPDKEKKKKPAHIAIEVAAPDPHNDPHAVDSLPAYNLSDDQVATVKPLQFLTDYEIAHQPKASPDVANAYTERALSTIAAHPELGGQARVNEIRATLALHGKLVAIANVLSPLLRLVGQNLLATSAVLARDMGEPLKVATSLKSTQPALLEGLVDLETWSHEHHRTSTHGKSASQTAGTPATATHQK